MADNSSEIPENPDSVTSFRPDPNKSIWDTFSEGRVEAPRDIADEVKKEQAGQDLTEHSITPEEANKKLAARFLELSKLLGSNYFKNEAMFLHIFHSDKVKEGHTDKDRSSEVKIIIQPNSNIINQELSPLFTTPFGNVPIFFKGKNGARYQATNNFTLNPHTGIGSKEEIVYKGDDGFADYSINDDALSVYDQVDFDGPVLNNKAEITPDDYERLNNWAFKIEQHELEA